MKTHIIALLLLTGGVLNLFGENLHNFFNRYNFSFITEDTGLPHNFINDIYKDTQGYMAQRKFLVVKLSFKRIA